MASMNPMILSFAESGLATFIRLYAEVYAEHGFQGPEPEKLHGVMRSKLNELDPESASMKRVQEDQPTCGIKEAEEPSCSIEEESVPKQASAPK